MANVTLRLVKGSPLTNQEVDDNFSNINISKVEIGGDLGGNIYTPTVTGIQGRNVDSTPPANAQVLTWIDASNSWVAANVVGGGGSVSYYDDLLTKPSINVTISGSVVGAANLTLLNTDNNSINIFTSIPLASIALGNDTYGNYTDRVVGGTGITAPGTADVGNVITVGLTTTGVVANTYGNATIVPVITVDAQGRITSVSNVAISGAGGGGGSDTLQTVTSRGSTTSNTITLTNTANSLVASGNIYTSQRIGWNNVTSNASVVYQFYNATTNSLDTVFG